MENPEIIDLWKSYNEKLESCLSINKQMAEDISKLKVKNSIASMKPIKIFTLFVGFVWVGFGSFILFHLYRYAFEAIPKFPLFSATIQILLTAIAVVVYLFQLILIHTVDISESIIDTQKKLLKLKNSSLWVTRILFLQMPVWATFFISESAIRAGNLTYILINGAIICLFIYAAIWLFFNIKDSNKDKKWFKFLFSGKEWTPIIKSMEILQQID